MHKTAASTLPRQRRLALGRFGLASLAALAALVPCRPLPPRKTFQRTRSASCPSVLPAGPSTGWRVYANKLAQRFGRAVIVEAKPGASGIIAAYAVAKAPPDGYTILMTLPLTHINAAVRNPKLPYDPVRDFAPLTMVGSGSPLLLARGDAPHSTLKKSLAFGETLPGSGRRTWGIGSGGHLFGELLRRQAGADIVHVPYKAESQNYSGLYGKVLDVTWANPG